MNSKLDKFVILVTLAVLDYIKKTGSEYNNTDNMFALKILIALQIIGL